jgi:hypothetical protein
MLPIPPPAPVHWPTWPFTTSQSMLNLMWLDRVRNVSVNKQQKQGFNVVAKVENMGDPLEFQFSRCLLQFAIN